VTESVNNDQSPLILVVDDDMAIRLMAREALEQTGFRVEEADDGFLALSAFEQLDPDLVLLDVMMPAMDGFTACCQIREMPKGEHIPIVMMTGLDDIASINRAYQVGASDFITKPINHLLLSYRVRYILRAQRTQDALRASETRLANAQRIAKIGHWEWDPEEDCIHWSQEILKILGSPSSEASATYGQFLECVHPEDRKKVESTVKKALHKRNGYSIEYRIVRPDGALRVVHQEAEVSLAETRRRIHLVGTIQDVTEQKRVEQQIHQLAYYNKVTGLPNRLMLKRLLGEALGIANQHGRRIAVLMLNVDHFSRINETFGYTVGEELLAKVSRRLVDCLHPNKCVTRDKANDLVHVTVKRSGDILAHISGDEFVLVLTEIGGAEDAAIVARRINDTLAAPFLLKGNEVSISASIGISVYPEDGEDVESLFKQGRAALNNAKGEGRNCYKFYTESMNARAFERLAMETALRKALAQNQFRLYYQPKVTIRGATVVGVEALVRWEHPEYGLVSPAEFISIAEETGLIIPLGEWVLNEACRQIVAWQIEGLPALEMSVNLSAVQFRQKDIYFVISRILRDTGMEPELLELEITESTLMSNVGSTIATLNQLKELGLRISIDDFGTGYSSLSYLKQFPISSLKIDRSFIRNVTHDPDDAAIVGAIIALAHSLRLKVVAEGVEQGSHLRFLRELGCAEVQGYYFSAPLPADAFAKWLLSRGASGMVQAVAS
jgi:PAS domain S-box-containing protein